MKIKPPSQISHVQLHPASYRYLLKGHPWVLKDNFTEKFKSKDRLLWATDKKTGKEFTLLNDTTHPKIKARLWSQGHVDFPQFRQDMLTRLQDSALKRKKYLLERDDIFLIFGEVDGLSGFFLLLLKEGFIIQAYSKLWKKYQKEIIPFLRENIAPKLGIKLKWISWQERGTKAQSTMTPLWGKMPQEFCVQEFGISYKINLGKGHDLGLYPDMAAIRKEFSRDFKGKKILNLYCYSGAWSLFPYAQGATSVTSLDLSSTSMEWLKENIALNKYNSHHFHFKTIDVLSGLKELKKEKELFDFIICDPPSFSHDGKKSTQALKSYRELFPLMADLLSEKGKALLFINTHALSKEKFEITMNTYAQRAKLKKIRSITPQEDILILPHFPEGNYLKGILFTKNKKG